MQSDSTSHSRRRPSRAPAPSRWPGYVTAALIAASAVLVLAAAPAEAGSAAKANTNTAATTVNKRCLSECTPRIGIVSAFGAEADLLLARLKQRKDWRIQGKLVSTGVLEGHRVAVTLSGVSMVNATLATQQLLDHFHIRRLVMSGIAGGVNPAHHVGDVTVPDRWAMPMEVYWSHDNQLPAPCGKPGDGSCLGLHFAKPDGRDVPAFSLKGDAGSSVPTGLFMRENHVLNAANAPAGEFRFDYPVDAAMLATARTLQPTLQRCGPKARQTDGTLDERQCVRQTPKLHVGGRGVSATVFLANPQYRQYLFEHLQAQTFEMETAALAHVAYANQVPYIAFRSLSDLAGAEAFDADVGALFTSGLAEHNEAEVCLSFLRAWRDTATAVRR
ncbi:5'-methylthioadenosine/S-adenosylhomocysteine nucleosidase [Ideonella margarita]|uniref:5'-methylthioadenosine/S-adenosylhomocysteine nucleosidase n=1 Tax=Ideonella margarita TaxID=2984191 RepID=A0ABU9C6W5_9BURK